MKNKNNKKNQIIKMIIKIMIIMMKILKNKVKIILMKFKNKNKINNLI